jgi:hypothetical protein
MVLTPGVRQVLGVPEQSKNSALPASDCARSVNVIAGEIFVVEEPSVRVNVTVPVAAPSPVASLNLDIPDTRTSKAIGVP